MGTVYMKLRRRRFEMKSEYRTLLFVDKPHPWYSINNSGHLICHLKNSNRIGARDRLGRILGGSSCPPQYDPSVKYTVKWSRRCNPDGSLKCLYKKLVFPEKFFEGTVYDGHQYQKSGGHTITKQIMMHQAVMWTFRDITSNPPADFNDEQKEAWENTPTPIKHYMQTLLSINHKDHDPSLNFIDLDDPTKDSIEYCSPKWNTRAAVKHYGGHVSNKGKMTDFTESEPEATPIELLFS